MGLGFWEIAILLVIVAIIFGAGKLPNVMGDLAKGIKSFKAELSGDKADPAGGPAPVAEATVAPAPATSAAPPTIDATATRVSVTEPVPPPARTA